MSFCSKCGKELQEGATFCGNCGQQTESNEKIENSLRKNQKRLKDNLKMMTRKQKILSAIVFLAIVFIIFAIALFVNRKEKMNLNDYVTVSYDGYDSVGTATVKFDYDKFDRDVKTKMRYENTTSQNALLNDIYDDINKSITLKLSKESNLKNGDKIKLEWNCQNNVAKDEYNILLEYKNKVLSVKKLEAITKIDPFKDITIEYNGITPSITAEVKNNSTDAVVKHLNFVLDKSYEISKGDTITVSVDSNAEQLLQQSGYVLTETTKTYTCDNVDSYITKMSDITDDYLKTLQNQANDTITACIAKEGNTFTTSERTYEGMYFLTSKNSNAWINNNSVYLVYSATVSSVDGKFQPFVIHMPVQFNNIILKADGSLSCTLTNSNVKGYCNIPNVWSYISGYEDTNKMHDELISQEATSYTYEISDSLKQYGN